LILMIIGGFLTHPRNIWLLVFYRTQPDRYNETELGKLEENSLKQQNTSNLSIFILTY